MINKKWKKVIFAIAIAMLFIPMVYLGVNTFFPEFTDNNCYERMPYRLSPCEVNDTACQKNEISEQNKRDDCYKTYQTNKKEYEGKKYIVLMIISLITSLVLLTKLDQSIIYGLFFGVVITAFTGTLRYIESKSFIGFFLMVALFISIIVFVQKMRKN